MKTIGRGTSIYLLTFLLSFIPENFFSQNPILNGNSKILNLLILVVYAVLVIGFLRGLKTRLRLSPRGVLFGGFLAAGVVWGFVSGHTVYYIILDLSGFSVIMLLDLIESNAILNFYDIKPEKVLKTFMLGNLAQSTLMQILQFIFGPVYTLNQNVMYFGAFTALVFFMNGRGRKNLLYLAIYTVLIVLRAKRSILVSAIILLVIPLIQGKRKFGYLLFLLFLSSIVLVLHFIFPMLGSQIYIFKRLSGFGNLSTVADMQLYGYAWVLFREFISTGFSHAALGAGLGELIPVGLFGTGYYNYFVDSLITTTTYKLGLVGLGCVFIFYSRLLSRCVTVFRKLSGMERTIAFGIALFVAINMFSAPFSLGIFYAKSAIPVLIAFSLMSGRLKKNKVAVPQTGNTEIAPCFEKSLGGI